MNTHRVEALDHAARTAHVWVARVAGEFGTEDHQFAYRVLRAWLHTLRDRLTVPVAAQFAAQLPELLRGVYYDSWVPAAAPHKFGAEEYRQRFARDAGISVHDVPRAAAAVTLAIEDLMSAGQLTHALDQLPAALRSAVIGEPHEVGTRGGTR